MVEAVQDRDEATVEAIAPFLSHDNEVIRCAALRAYAACAPEARARRALLGLLMDPDPDIRTDAVERLVSLAKPEDAETLRASLEGDPVREVKVAAIEALGVFRDEASVPLLRRLVHSRGDESISWEDDIGDWDDWLDVQVAAVAGLGWMRIEDAIEDLMIARNDEFGQNMDDVVFGALVNMGAPGIDCLLQIIRAEGARPARRAAAAIANADLALLAPLADELLASTDVDVRKTALRSMAADDPRAADLARNDPAADVQRAALRHIASARPEEIEAALQSGNERVQAEALSLLDGAVSPELREALVNNLLVWLGHAGPDLATAAAKALPRFAPNLCETPLLDVVSDTDRPLETRVAAVAGLAARVPPVETDLFSAILANPARQVRTAALAEMARRAKCGDLIANDTMVAAIRGELVSTEAEVGADEVVTVHDAAAPKGEGGPQTIRITRDGEIIEGEEAPSGSTLHGILAASQEPAPPPRLVEDTPEESPAKRNKRQPVEGISDFAALFQADAIGLCRDTCDARVEEALLGAALSGPEQCRPAAWTALRHWPAGFEHSKAVRSAALAAMRADAPIVRSAAFAVLAKGAVPAEALGLALENEDGLLRADAVAHLPAQTAFDFLADPSPAVRQVSVARIVEEGEADLECGAVRRLLATEWTDTLRDLFSKSQAALSEGFRQLAEAKEPKQALILLEGLAGSKPS